MHEMAVWRKAVNSSYVEGPSAAHPAAEHCVSSGCCLLRRHFFFLEWCHILQLERVSSHPLTQISSTFFSALLNTKKGLLHKAKLLVSRQDRHKSCYNYYYKSISTSFYGTIHPLSPFLWPFLAKRPSFCTSPPQSPSVYVRWPLLLLLLFLLPSSSSSVMWIAVNDPTLSLALFAAATALLPLLPLAGLFSPAS